MLPPKVEVKTELGIIKMLAKNMINDPKFNHAYDAQAQAIWDRAGRIEEIIELQVKVEDITVTKLDPGVITANSYSEQKLLVNQGVVVPATGSELSEENRRILEELNKSEKAS